MKTMIFIYDEPPIELKNDRKGGIIEKYSIGTNGWLSTYKEFTDKKTVSRETVMYPPHKVDRIVIQEQETKK